MEIVGVENVEVGIKAGINQAGKMGGLIVESAGLGFGLRRVPICGHVHIIIANHSGQLN